MDDATLSFLYRSTERVCVMIEVVSGGSEVTRFVGFGEVP